MSEFKYRPDIDGLRAIAVVLVLLFHGGFGFTGGFIGVDVFFVISGFLITGLILKEQRSEKFRISQFWIRRIRRILPASLFVVAATLLASLFVLLPDDYESLAKSAIAQQLMVANIYFWKHTGYFEGDAELKPLLHTWSLGVEEQFYILYPFCLVLLRRYSTPTKVATLFLALSASFSLSVWGAHSHPSEAFYLLPGRAWEMLLGGVLCFVPSDGKINRWIADAVCSLGLSGILIPAWYFDSTMTFPGLSALLPCGAAAMVIYSNTRELTRPGKLLAAKPIVYIGLMSYSLYLWHWPALSLLRHLSCGTAPGTVVRAGVLAATFLLAAVSLHYVESPFRARKVLPGTRQLLLAAGSASAMVLAFSLFIVCSNGLPQRFDPRVYTYASVKSDHTSYHRNVTAGQVTEGEVPTFGAASGLHKCLVWGDSHAMALIPGIDVACRNSNIQGFQATYSATAPILDFYEMDRAGLSEHSTKFNRAVVDFAVAEQVDLIIMGGVWHRYSRQPNFEQCLHRTVRELTDAGIQVTIVRDVARFQGVPSFQQRSDVPLLLSMAARFGRNVQDIGVPVEEYLSQNQECNQIVNRIAASNQSLTILDPLPFFVDKAGLWRAEYDGQSLYCDDHHLSIQGSLRLQPMFESYFKALWHRP